MKKLLFISAILWATVAYSSAVLDVQFFDSSGKDYRTVTLATDIERHYGFKPRDPKVLLIEVASFDTPEYREQNTAINHLKHEVEKHEVLIVLACPVEADNHGYHTTVEAAQNLSGNNSDFRVRLLNHSGVIIKTASRPVPASELRIWLSST